MNQIVEHATMKSPMKEVSVVLLRFLITAVAWVALHIYFLFLLSLFGQINDVVTISQGPIRFVTRLPALLSLLTVGLSWYIHLHLPKEKNWIKYFAITGSISIMAVTLVWLTVQKPARNAFIACTQIRYQRVPISLEEFKKDNGAPNLIDYSGEGEKWHYANFGSIKKP